MRRRSGPGVRRLYVGDVVWNKSQKRDAWGQRKSRPRDESEWVRLRAPELRIIGDALWARAHERLAMARASYSQVAGGALAGRPANGVASKYLLTGFAVCAGCGGAMTPRSRSHGTSRLSFYACQTNRVGIALSDAHASPDGDDPGGESRASSVVSTSRDSRRGYQPFRSLEEWASTAGLPTSWLDQWLLASRRARIRAEDGGPSPASCGGWI
jgi:Recombinase/Recombinase zinc beta ribbon domain